MKVFIVTMSFVLATSALSAIPFVPTFVDILSITASPEPPPPPPDGPNPPPPPPTEFIKI